MTKYLFFWGHQRLVPGCLSQWWPAEFLVDGVAYPTAEHYMMAGKANLFGDNEIAERIRLAAHPHAAKELGRQVRGFDQARWEAHRFDIVVDGNLAKFGQHADLREFLLGTGDRVLVEASPVDPVWGIGLAADDERAASPDTWQGTNLLGYALMQVRERLRRQEGPVLIGGVEKREIKLVDYDPAWPVRFESERARIITALGEMAREVEHVGSTSVPGLTAKPIVDIDVSVPNVDDEDAYLPPLLAAGYELRVRQPGHRMVRTPELDVHVHICGVGSDWVRRDLIFRDQLRRDAADRAAYAALKRELAQRDWTDMNAYADAKGGLIAEITARARPTPTTPCS